MEDNTKQPAAAPIIVNGGGAAESKKGVSPWVWVGGGLAALLLLNRSSGPGSSTGLSGAQQDILLQAGAGDPGQLTLQPKDDSPMIFTTGDQSMDVKTLDAMIKDHYARYTASCTKIAAKLQTDATVVFATVAILFGELPKGKTVTEKSLDGYFKVLDIWSVRFDSALGVVSRAVSDILTAQISGLNTASKCTKWVYIRSDEITQSESTAKTAVVTNTNKANNGFCGIVGKTKSNSSETINSSTVTQEHNQKTTFIPFCEKFQLDPTVVMSVLSSSSVSLALQYDLLSAVLAMAPKPENFLTNVAGNV